MAKAVGCLAGWDAVRFLVDGMVCGKVERVLFFFSVEVLQGLPQTLMWVPGLEGGGFKLMYPSIGI